MVRNGYIEIVTSRAGNIGNFTQFELLKQNVKQPDFKQLKYKYKLEEEDTEAMQPIISQAIINRKKFMSMTNR